MAKERIDIQAIFRAQRANAGIKRLRGGMNLLSSAMRAVFRTTIVAGFFLALRAVYMAVQNIKNAITSIVPELMKMNAAATLTAAVMSKGGVTFQKNFEGAAQMARNASAAIGKAATEIQSGLFIAGIAGFDLADALKLTEQSMKLAAVSGMAFKQVMNDTISISRGFRVTMEELPGVANTLAAAFTSVKMELADVFQGLKRVAAVAVTAFGPGKETIFDMSAAIMTLNDVGVEASRAATYMRSGITRLLAPTNKVTTAFAKYGINIFQADAKNQRFLGTLLKGQSALSDYYEKLNKLKKRQFDLVLSGDMSSKAFENVNDKLSEVNKTMSMLDNGVSDVYKQFTMAGGQLKPFNELLDELINKKIPPEVVAGIFGVRTGQMITTLLANPEKFKKNKRYLVEMNKEYERGNSILTEMYHRILETLAVKWARLGTTIKSVFSAVFDAAAPTIGKLFDPVLDGLTAIYDSVEKNKGLFAKLFEGVGALVEDFFQGFGSGLKIIATQIKNVVTMGVPLKLPEWTYHPATKDDAGKPVRGRIEKTNILLSKGASFEQRLSLLSRSLKSLFSSTFYAALDTLKPALDTLAKFFVDAVIVQLELQSAFFVKVGGWIAEGLVKALGKWLSTSAERGADIVERRRRQAGLLPKQQTWWDTLATPQKSEKRGMGDILGRTKEIVQNGRLQPFGMIETPGGKDKTYLSQILNQDNFIENSTGGNRVDFSQLDTVMRENTHERSMGDATLLKAFERSLMTSQIYGTNSQKAYRRAYQLEAKQL